MLNHKRGIDMDSKLIYEKTVRLLPSKICKASMGSYECVLVLQEVVVDVVTAIGKQVQINSNLSRNQINLLWRRGA